MFDRDFQCNFQCNFQRTIVWNRKNSYYYHWNGTNLVWERYLTPISKRRKFQNPSHKQIKSIIWNKNYQSKYAHFDNFYFIHYKKLTGTETNSESFQYLCIHIHFHNYITISWCIICYVICYGMLFLFNFFLYFFFLHFFFNFFGWFCIF